MRGILFLAIALLLASNAWLGYRLLETGNARAQLELHARYQNDSLLMCVAIGNQILSSETRREPLVAAARAAGGNYRPYGNDGHLWLGAVGMRFDESGSLVSLAEWMTVDDKPNQRGRQ